MFDKPEWGKDSPDYYCDNLMIINSFIVIYIIILSQYNRD